MIALVLLQYFVRIW